MAAILVRHDQIGGVLVVELVDLEAVLEHRHVPFEQVDEDALARLEHVAKGGQAERGGNGFERR